MVILCRSDGREVPAWSDVEHLRDGRERLGYNPGVEKREVTREDLDAVRAGGGGVSSKKAATQHELPHKGGDRAALAKL